MHSKIKFLWLLALLVPDSQAPVRELGGFPTVRYCADLSLSMGTCHMMASGYPSLKLKLYND